MTAASISQTIAQDITFNTPNLLEFDTVDFDTSTGAGWTANPNVITVDTPGLYFVGVSVSFPSGSLPSGSKGLQLGINAGGALSRDSSSPVSGDTRNSCEVSAILNVTAAPHEIGASVVVSGVDGDAELDTDPRFRAQLQVTRLA